MRTAFYSERSVKVAAMIQGAAYEPRPGLDELLKVFDRSAPLITTQIEAIRKVDPQSATRLTKAWVAFVQQVGFEHSASPRELLAPTRMQVQAPPAGQGQPVVR